MEAFLHRVANRPMAHCLFKIGKRHKACWGGLKLGQCAQRNHGCDLALLGLNSGLEGGISEGPVLDLRGSGGEEGNIGSAGVRF